MVFNRNRNNVLAAIHDLKETLMADIAGLAADVAALQAAVAKLPAPGVTSLNAADQTSLDASDAAVQAATATVAALDPTA